MDTGFHESKEKLRLYYSPNLGLGHTVFGQDFLGIARTGLYWTSMDTGVPREQGKAQTLLYPKSLNFISKIHGLPGMFGP